MSSGIVSGSDSIPAKLYETGSPPLTGKLIKMYHTMWNQKKPLRNSKMLQLLTSTHGKKTGRLAITTNASPYIPLQGKSWPGSCWSVWINTLSKTCRQSMCNLLGHWNSRYGICCKAVARELSRTECQPLHYLWGPDQGLWHCQPWWAAEDHAQVWLSPQFYHFGQAVPWSHAHQKARWWWVLTAIPVTNGVNESCVMVPILFNMIFSAILKDAFC